eukprot:evm.model.NODE_2189_length_70754_cov_51.271378.16
MVGQKGPLTRIASGCTLEEQAALEALYAKLDQGRNKFRLHFTPDFSKDQASGQTYYFYNKPGGLQHWLASPASPPDDTVIAVIDPDFIFMRPLTAKVKADGIIFSGPVQAWDLIEEEQVREYLDPTSGPALSVNDRAYHKYHAFQYCQVVMKTNKALQKYKSLFCDVDDNSEAEAASSIK